MVIFTVALASALPVMRGVLSLVMLSEALKPKSSRPYNMPVGVAGAAVSTIKGVPSTVVVLPAASVACTL